MGAQGSDAAIAAAQEGSSNKHLWCKWRCECQCFRTGDFHWCRSENWNWTTTSLPEIKRSGLLSFIVFRSPLLTFVGGYFTILHWGRNAEPAMWQVKMELLLQGTLRKLKLNQNQSILPVSYPQISMFVFNPSHDERLQYLVDILPNTIFNWKTTFKFQKLNLYSFDIQSRKQQLIARHLKQRSAYFSDDTSWYRWMVVQRQDCTASGKRIRATEQKP